MLEGPLELRLAVLVATLILPGFRWKSPLVIVAFAAAAELPLRQEVDHFARLFLSYVSFIFNDLIAVTLSTAAPPWPGRITNGASGHIGGEGGGV